MTFMMAILVGLLSGIVVFPLGLWIFKLYRNAKERRMIKRLLRKGEFLITIDPRDYDVKAWQGHEYGNINPDLYVKDLRTLNAKIFKKDAPTEGERVIILARNYVDRAREMKFTDEQIRSEFAKKNYAPDMINKIMEMSND